MTRAQRPVECSGIGGSSVGQAGVAVVEEGVVFIVPGRGSQMI
jgi:hypothetical protein